MNAPAVSEIYRSMSMTLGNPLTEEDSSHGNESVFDESDLLDPSGTVPGDQGSVHLSSTGPSTGGNFYHFLFTFIALDADGTCILNRELKTIKLSFGSSVE